MKTVAVQQKFEKIMRFTKIIVTITFLLAFGHFAQAQTSATAIDASQYGWLEGTITNSDGVVIANGMYSGDGKTIKGIRQGGGEFNVQSNAQLGGLYSAKNLRPGTYDITLEKGYVGNTAYCPERIFGVVVKPGQRTILNIVMDQGTTYEEVGKPNFISAPATNITTELQQMQKQIDDLKQQVASLQQKIGTPATPTPIPAK